MMNVLRKDLVTFKSFAVKGCQEIQFAHGGHLFACIAASQIQIYNFWTTENPSYHQFKAHQNKVRCINWYEDDSGFVSCGADGAIYNWNLKEAQKNEDEHMDKTTVFSSVVKVPE
jgi:hypothetical protein